MSEFDNFLDSLDIEETPSTPTTRNLSEDDFNDVLSEMGFEEAPEDIHDGSDDEGVEEERDLDAEEDADWEERIASGEVREASDWDTGAIRDAGIATAVASSQANVNRRREVQMHNSAQIMANSNGDILGEFVADAVQDSAAYFHMPNGMTIDVPIVQEPPAEEETPSTSQSEDFLIPPNSPTLLMDDSTSRFSGAEWYDEIRKQRIILAGLGGIGGWTALQLARMSPASLILYDDDVVEMANMSGQLYGNDDIGLSKVDAISRTLQKYTTAQNIFALNQRFTPETEAGSIMICGFDNMEARRTFFNKWLEYVEEKPMEEQKKCLYLDGRLSIDTLQVFCITGDDRFNINKYRSEYLFSDEEAEHTVCSMKQTTYLACMIGSFIVNLFTNHVANLLDPIIPYDLPFFTEYDAQNMIFKTIK